MSVYPAGVLLLTKVYLPSTREPQYDETERLHQ